MAQSTGYAFVGNGVLTISEVNSATGEPTDYDYLGNVTACNISFASSRVERRNYQRRGMPIDRAANISDECGISLTTNDLDRRILQLYFGGTESVTAPGTVTLEALPLNRSASKWSAPGEAPLLALRNTNIDLAATVTLRYGTVGSITNVVPAQNYTLTRGGNLLINATYFAGLAANAATHWNIDYSHLGSSNFAAGKRVSGCTKNYWLRIEGNNLAVCGAGEFQTVDIYKTVLTPEGDLSLIGEDFTEMAFSGRILADTTRTLVADEEYFRVRRYG